MAPTSPPVTSQNTKAMEANNKPEKTVRAWIGEGDKRVEFDMPVETARNLRNLQRIIREQNELTKNIKTMESKVKIKTTVVASINGIDILASTKDNELVPIRPICQLFGIAPNGQIVAIKENPLFNSVSKICLSTGADGKQYEMFCLPVEYLFGWMLSINSSYVKQEVRENLLTYQKECVAALKEHFFGKFRKLEKSFEKSAKLEVERQALLAKKDMADDLRRYLEITKELKEEKVDRSKNSRSAFKGMISLFTPKEMTGQ